MNIFSFITSFLRQLNEACQSSSLCREMMGNKAADLPRQIALLL